MNNEMWTSIKDSPAPVGVPLMVTVDRGSCEGPRKVVIGPVYYMKSSFGGRWGFFENGSVDHQIGPDFFKVTAWMHWPAAYEEVNNG